MYWMGRGQRDETRQKRLQPFCVHSMRWPPFFDSTQNDENHFLSRGFFRRPFIVSRMRSIGQISFWQQPSPWISTPVIRLTVPVHQRKGPGSSPSFMTKRPLVDNQ
jgi:hypothetical protein